jgi:uncharacterized ion transporter superfamily protein YfcC
LQPGSGAGFRTAFLLIATFLWIFGTMRVAAKNRTDPSRVTEPDALGSIGLGTRGLLIVGAVTLSFVVFVIGIMKYGWDFDQLAAPFVAMGILAGLIGGLGPSGTALAFAEGFASMASAAMLIGTARAISVVLEQGHVIDTIVHALVAPLASMPTYASAIGMMLMHVAVHVPVPSVSGQAVLTMPVLIPVGDLVSIPRQAVVLAYQYGAGMTDLVTPTNGGMMAVLAAANVPFEKWWRFALPLFCLMLALGAISVTLAIAVRL